MTDTTDAQLAEDARQFLAVWTGGKHLSDEHREDFIAAWTGWHRGAEFQRECDERDAKAAIGSSVSPPPAVGAVLAAAPADARKAES